MTDLRSQLQGLWLPLATPFRDGTLDEASLRRLVRHYATGPVDGWILAATLLAFPAAAAQLKPDTVAAFDHYMLKEIHGQPETLVKDAKSASDAETRKSEGTEVLGEGATADPTGLDFSGRPSWVLLADSNVSTLDVTKPTASFGVQRSSPRDSLRVMIRKNLAEKRRSIHPG